MQIAEEEAINRTKKLEANLNQLQRKVNYSNEVKTQQELSILKSKFDDLNAQIQTKVEENNQLLKQRNEYRQAAGKLVRQVYSYYIITHR